jgi:spermidine/putrescine transport system substrate-binding protein
MPSVLAACGLRSPTASHAAPVDWDAWWADQRAAGVIDFANWPYYIDRRRDNSHPSLERFTSSTATTVNYSRPIRGNARFLEKIRPALEAGRPIGYDIIVVTNGPELSTLIDNGWVTPLDHTRLKYFEANASDLVRDPPFDRGNRFTVAWQSGLTGIGYRPEAVEALGREPRSVADLWDTALTDRVGMFVDEMDLGSFGLMAVGVDPESSSVYDWSQAAQALRRQRNSGVVRGYYDQEYIGALQRGDVWISQAWSGDIFQARQLGHPELRFILPEEGAMLWTDNMMIPLHAAHPVDAMTYIDFVYHPEVAAMIADWVWYITPVPAAQPIIRERFGDPVVADSHLVFPEAASLGAPPPPIPDDSGTLGITPSGQPPLRRYYVFRSADELATWRRFFGPIVEPPGVES